MGPAMSFHDIKESQRSNFKSPKILKLFHDRLVFVFILHIPFSVPQFFFLSSSDAKKSLFTKWLMMKCFLPCFGAKSKRTKHFRSPIATPTATAAASNTHLAEGAFEPIFPLTQQNNVEEHIDCIVESKEEQEKAEGKEETPHIGEKKDEHEEDHEANESLLHEECSESLFSLSIDSRKQASTEIEVNSPMQHPSIRKEEYEASEASPSVSMRVQHASSVLNPLENLAQGKPPLELRKGHKEPKEKDTKLLIGKPEEQPNCIAIRKVNPNEESSAEEQTKMLEENNEEKGKERVWNNQLEYRYRDCCDDGYEDVNVDESDFDATFEDDDHHNEKKREGGEGDAKHVNGTWIQEESSESLFSLSIDSRKRISSAENVDNEVNSLIMPPHVTKEEEEESQGRIAHVSSVLNPIENVTQEGRLIKAVTVSKKSLKNKENINFVAQDVDIDIPFSPEPNLKLSNHKSRNKKFNDKKQEIGVDTSLSSWLVEPETTPISVNSREHTPNSVVSHEDRPILGALSIEEIKKYSVSISSRRSRSRSPDETPIIGTVGSYWSHTGQCMDSELNKHHKETKLTLKSRLERAFEAEV